MSEYQIKYQIKTNSFFPKTFTNMDIIQANTAKEAMEKWKEENRANVTEFAYMGMFPEILSIEKI